MPCIRLKPWVAAMAVALALPVTAHAVAPVKVAPLTLPPPNAPASTYGPLVRGGDGPPNADDLAGLAERQREAGHLAAALALSLRARHFAPDNVQAIQTETNTLSDMGAPRRAWQLAQEHHAMFPADSLQRLRADVAAADIRAAVRERTRLEKRFLYAQRNDALIGALHELDENLKVFPKGSAARERTQRDRLFVLTKLGRMSEALALYAQLERESGTQPAYVEQSAAAANYALHHPRRAAAMYRQLIARNPGIDVDTRIAHYYALIDAEDYAAAARVLASIDRETPVWMRRPGPRAANWERSDVDQLLVMDAAYRNHNAEAVRRAEALYASAPHNTNLVNTYATVLRWRGWPQQAQQVTALAAAYAPEDKSTRLNEADDARELEQYDRWHALIAPLATLFPDDTTIARSLAEWNDRSHASMSAQFTAGHSSSNAPISGNQDQTLTMRVNSPWNDAGLRAYGVQNYGWSNFGDYDASINRVGVGAEWNWGRKDAWVQVSDDRLTGRHAGVSAGWSQWLDDHWQYVLGADSYSAETPLRAIYAGYRGRQFQAQVNWRGSESQSASLGVSATDISDGNHRLDFTASFTQRVQASAHHLTDVTLQASDENNSQPGGDYFNPSGLHSLGVSVEHEWITWRRYDRSFTQRFVATAASEWESGYGSAGGFDLEYLHTWQLSRTWSLNYGIGWGSHVYDGDRERRLYGTIGFGGVF